MYEEKAALENIRDKVYKRVSPIAEWLNDMIMLCTLYMDKRSMDRKRRRGGGMI